MKKIIFYSLFLTIVCSKITFASTNTYHYQRFDTIPYSELLHQTAQVIMYHGSIFGDISHSKNEDSIYIMKFILKDMDKNDQMFINIWNCYRVNMLMAKIHNWAPNQIQDTRTDEYFFSVISEVPIHVIDHTKNENFTSYPIYVELYSPIVISTMTMMPIKLYAINRFPEIDGYFYIEEMYLLTFNTISKDNKSYLKIERTDQVVLENTEIKNKNQCIIGSSVSYGSLNKCCVQLEQLLEQHPELRIYIKIPGF